MEKEEQELLERFLEDIDEGFSCEPGWPNRYYYEIGVEQAEAVARLVRKTLASLATT